MGVDVSKAKLDAALLKPDGKYRSKVFSNNQAGFKDLLQWIKIHVAPQQPEVQLQVCMEATGSYHEALAYFLVDNGIGVSVVNPLLVKRFIEVDRVRNKTDAGDARCLARFSQMTNPPLWEAPSVGVRACKPWCCAWILWQRYFRASAIAWMLPTARCASPLRT